MKQKINNFFNQNYPLRARTRSSKFRQNKMSFGTFNFFFF